MQQLPTLNDRLFNGNPWLFNLSKEGEQERGGHPWPLQKGGEQRKGGATPNPSKREGN